MVARRILVDMNVCVPGSKTELEDTVDGAALLGSAGDEEMIGRRGGGGGGEELVGCSQSPFIRLQDFCPSRDAMHLDGSPLESIRVKYVDCGRIAALC